MQMNPHGEAATSTPGSRPRRSAVEDPSSGSKAPRLSRAGRRTRSRVVRRHAVAARVVLVALLAAVLVPLEQPESWTTPVTMSETITGLAAADSSVAATPRSGDAGASLAGTDAGSSRIELSELVEAPISFSAVGITAPDHAGPIAIRTSDDGQSWTEWLPIEYLQFEDGPDPGSDDERATTPGQHTEPLWVGEANYLQLQVDDAEVAELEVTVIDSMRLNDGPVERHRESATAGTGAHASELEVISRARWGADESITGSTRSVENVHMGIVHHTAHSPSSSVANGYTRAEAPGVMRAMHRYHTVSLGWSDLGYNVVIDGFGQVYEGRRGGFSNGVIGAHARGYNTGSFGVSVMGNFTDVQAPAAAIESLTRVIGVKSAIHGIDPTGWTNRLGNGAWRPTIVGHRDVGPTACPGRIQDQLPSIREDARDTAVRFPDVLADSPHRGPVMALAELGVTNGCTANLYCPKDTLTRGQAASFMVRAFDLERVPGTPFSDVPGDFVHSDAINALVERGWLIGYDDGTFRPNEELTRGQLATLLGRSFDDEELEAQLEEAAREAEEAAREAEEALGDGELEGELDLDADESLEQDASAEPETPSEETTDPLFEDEITLAPDIDEDPYRLRDPDEVAPYPDVDASFAHYEGIMRLARRGIRGDCNGRGSFCPGDPVLRDSTASFVYEVRLAHGLR